MSKPKKAEHHDDVGGHGDRPWVYFMIDCFLLMVNFFIVTFKFKTEEPILPQKMPPGTQGGGRKTTTAAPEKLVVHAKRENDQVVYEYMARKVGLNELSQSLAGVANSNRKVQVRVSYSDDCQWQDVISVFDECSKLKIDECGLIPSRSMAAGRQ